MKKITTSDFIFKCNELYNNLYDYNNVVYNGVGNKITISCKIHGEFSKIARDHLNGQGCPICSKINKYNKYKLSNNDIIDRFKLKHGDKYDYSLVDYVGLKTNVNIICNKHGIFKQIPSVHLKGEGCKKCYLEKRGLHDRLCIDEFINRSNIIHKYKYDYTKTIYQPNNKITIICPEHGEFKQMATSHLNGQGCKECSINKSKNNSFAIKAKELNPLYDYSKIEYINAKTKIKIICHDHGEFEQTPNNHVSKEQGCPKCALKYNKSEDNIKEFIKSLNLDFELNNRTILNGKELDIYIPSKNIAIEYNGLYWHSELYKSNDYHLNKTEECEKFGIQLIHIFEDEWLHKQDIVKSRLKNILGLTENRIYARKTEIKLVSSKDSKIFLDNNHIQGNVNSSIKLGLYYNNELVSLMTFGNLRKNLNSKSEEGKYELFRFCNKLNTTVIGGANKLLKYFIGIYNPKEIISYADRRWSTGNLYEKLGFSFIHNSEPNYFYILNNKREYRFKYRKDVLVKNGFDKDKTEKEIMLERGIYRIYDSGNKKYVLSNL